MGSFEANLMVFVTLAFAMAVKPAFSVVGWEESFMPNPSVCYRQMDKANGCQQEVSASLLHHKIKLCPECCEAIRGMSQRCKLWFFNRRGGFTPEFGNQIKGFCAGLGITLPPSYRVYHPMDNPSAQLKD